jgi:hypothetical protein
LRHFAEMMVTKTQQRGLQLIGALIITCGVLIASFQLPYITLLVCMIGGLLIAFATRLMIKCDVCGAVIPKGQASCDRHMAIISASVPPEPLDVWLPRIIPSFLFMDICLFISRIIMLIV